MESENNNSILSSVVDALCAADHGEINWKKDGGRLLPSREQVVEIIEALRSVLFPGYFGISELSNSSIRFHVGATLDRVMRLFEEQIRRGLCFTCGHYTKACPECTQGAEQIIRSFLKKLPQIQNLLAEDVRAAYEGDPAAASTAETIFCYPGILAITYYRLAHELYQLRVPLIPRIITEHAHSLTGIDIHPGARIGENFFIDHGTGVVIGETCIIGKRVTLYQGVTLGAKSFPLTEDGKPLKGLDRHPVVEDRVIIYSGATILGRVVIGEGSIIGGNVWITEDVAPGSRITLSSKL